MVIRKAFGDALNPQQRTSGVVSHEWQARNMPQRERHRQRKLEQNFQLCKQNVLSSKPARVASDVAVDSNQLPGCKLQEIATLHDV